MPHQIERVLRALQTDPWAIRPDYLDTITDVVVGRALYGPADPETAAAARAAGEQMRADHRAQHGADEDGMRVEGGRLTAVIPILGPLMHRGSIHDASSGIAGCTGIAEALGEAQRAGADRIVLDIDSPGGDVAGIPELAAAIRDVRAETVGVANTMAASAAYWLASACDQIVSTPSGRVGSIGIVTAHREISAKLARAGVRVTVIAAGAGKTDASPFSPLSDAAAARIQAEVEALYTVFVGQVAAGRRVTAETVRDTWQAHTYAADEALAAGLIDRIDTLDAVLADPAPAPAAMDPRHRRARRAAESRARRQARLC